MIRILSGSEVRRRGFLLASLESRHGDDVRGFRHGRLRHATLARPRECRTLPGCRSGPLLRLMLDRRGAHLTRAPVSDSICRGCPRMGTNDFLGGFREADPTMFH